MEVALKTRFTVTPSKIAHPGYPFFPQKCKYSYTCIKKKTPQISPIHFKKLKFKFY